MTTFEELRVLGLNVIPCHPKSKKPKVDWLAYKTTKYTGPLGNDNAAVMCGVTSGNLVVIDIDRADLVTKFFDNFEGVKQKTRVTETGKGYHTYCHPKGPMIPIIKLIDSNGLPVGELRGQGGYVMAEGSIHDVTGKVYKNIGSQTNIEEIDLDAFLNHLKENGIRPQSSLPPINEILKDVPIGNRDNATFKYAAHLISQGFVYEEVLAAVKVWSEKLGFAKVHVSAVKSAWKRVKRPLPPQNEEEVDLTEDVGVTKMKNIRMKNEGKDITFDALIALTDDIKSTITLINANCNDCGSVAIIKGNGYSNPILPVCENCKTKMKWDFKTQEVTDVMPVLIEEFLEESKHNSPRRINGLVNGENVFKTFAGQRKRITATLKAIANRDPKDGSDIVLHIKSLEDLDEPEDEQPTVEELTKWKGLLPNPDYMKRLCGSFNPEIFCDLQIKKMLMFSIIGGSQGVTRRTNSHSLLIGNPSRGKSELLKFVLKVVQKSTYIIGMNSSKAGLGSGMVKINGRMIPRAGVLVTHSGGLVALDELDKMDKDDKNAVLECMEQQTVTLVKSGIEEHLTAKTTIIAAANPIYGTWDDSLGPMENIDLDAFLVSRFDILWKFGVRSEQETSNISLKRLGLAEESVKPLLSESELRRFLNYMKKQNPGICREAKIKIHEFYMRMSKKTGDSMTLPMDDRQEEGLMRFTCAAAKAKFKNEADEEDVEEAIQLYRDSLASFGISTEGDVQQMRLTDKVLTKEQELLDLIHKCMDEDEEFLSKDVIMEWAKTIHFKSTESATKHFERLIGDKVLRTESGRYRLTRLT
jgi:DNA replicative helicase MCM subunit Mcm2 (Cdc46/Mcm family)